MNTSTEIFDIPASIAAQKEYQKVKGYPDLAPRDGVCFKCHSNIYAPRKRPDGSVSGVSLEKASTQLVTGCPHCHFSYCE